MDNEWQIGTEAKELDNKHISERMRVEPSVFKKIIVATLVYFITMIIFCIFL